MTEKLIDTLEIGIFMWYDNNIKEYAEINYKINKIYCDKYGYTLIKSDIIFREKSALGKMSSVIRIF